MSKEYRYLLTCVIAALCVLISWSPTAALSDKRLCADPNCEKIISLARSKISYNAGEPGMVSFKINTPIRVKSKSAGSNPNLWGIEVNGRQGYAPKEYILENRVLIADRDLKFEVPVARAAPTQPAALKASEIVEVKPDEETITAPLEVPAKKEEPAIVTDAGNLSETSPQQATNVQKNLEVVDGTAIPALEDTVEVEVPTEKADVLTKVIAPTLKVDTPTEKTKASIEKVETSAEKQGSTSTIKTEAPLDKVDTPTINTETPVEKLKVPEKIDTPTENVDTTTPVVETAKAKVHRKEFFFEEEDDDDDDDEGYDPDGIFGEFSTKQSTAAIQLEKPQLKTVDDQKTDNGTVTEASTTPTTLENVKKADAESAETLGFVGETAKGADVIANVKEEKPTLEPGVKQEDSKEHKKKSEDNLASTSLPIGGMQELSEDDDDDDLNEIEGLPTSDKLADLSVFGEEIKSESNEIKETAKVNESLSIVINESKKETVKLEKATSATLETKTANTDSAESVSEAPKINTILTESEHSTQPDLLDMQALFDEPTESTPKARTSEKQETDKFNHPDKKVEIETSPPVAKTEAAEPVTMPTLPLFQTPVAASVASGVQTQSGEQHAPLEKQEDITEMPVTEPLIQKEYFYQLGKDEQQPDQSHDKEITNQEEQEPSKVQPSQPSQYSPFPDAPQTGGEFVQENQVHPAKGVEQEKVLNTPPIPEVDVPSQPESNELKPKAVGSVEKLTSKSATLETSTHAKTTTDVHEVKEEGLFNTILGAVNNFISSDKRELSAAQDFDDGELQRILYPEKGNKMVAMDAQFCEKVSPHDCPSQSVRQAPLAGECNCDFADITLDNFAVIFAGKILERSDLLACVAIAAVTMLFFLFGYYCFCNSSKEGGLLSKLNLLERSLLATHKENAILKHDLIKMRSKLSSIEDNSFGSNDMVMALKHELEEERTEKEKSQEQVGNLMKELEIATESALELNKIVSDLLTNQTGDEHIISSVEELQKQLNEQQNTILEINTNLAGKSRENSELQLMLAEQNARLGGEIASLQQDNDELEAEKAQLQTRLEELKTEFEEDITKALESKNFEIKRLQSEIVEMQKKLDNEHNKWQTSLAKVEALEECLRIVKRDPSVNIKEVIDVAHVRAELIDMQKKRASLQERLDAETDVRRVAENQLQVANSELEKLKQSFNQSEKDKLEAQTRLEVLSNYFREKETQLQKELSLKETMWLKQQGETTSTVDRLTTMQEEIQSLKSQNDALRAEIEAQLAAHKAQTGTLENRAHETWLAARQSERRYEEARAEATALRRKLTALAGGNLNDHNRAVGDGKISNDLNNAPSPIHMESPGSPLLGRMPPLPFLQPPFMGPPPPFMSLPPPFVPPGEMRPAPLGRIMSPPPPGSGPPLPPLHHTHLRGGRYSPDLDYDDYDDYDDDDDDEEKLIRRGRRGSLGNGSWHRDSYSPPRTYRSHSPSDSRYNSTDRELVSTYDTDNDLSPPPSPSERRARGSRSGSYRNYSPRPIASSPISNSNRGKPSSSLANKNSVLSSGSDKSYNSSSHGRNGGKSMV